MRRKFYALVLVLVAFAMFQRPAYAMTARIPWGDMSGEFAYCAGKHTDAYSAAAELAGYDLSSLTREQRTALLDVNGDYVAYGQLAERLSTLSQVAEDTGGAVGSFFNVSGWLELMGLDEIWVYRASNDDLIEQAALDIQECIAEHPRATGNPDPDSGGGGSGGDEVELNGYTYEVVYSGSKQSDVIYTLDNYSASSGSQLWDFTKISNDISSHLSGQVDFAISFLVSTNKYNFCLFHLSDGLVLGKRVGTTDLYLINPTNDRLLAYYRRGYSSGYTIKDGTYIVNVTGGTSGSNYVNANQATKLIGMYDMPSRVDYLYSGGGTTNPPYTPTLPQYPNNDIPDPTNITLPNITLPNITLPNLDLPDIQPSNPTYNTYTYNTYNTATGNDVIPYLRNIIDWLAEIDLDIVTGLNALGDIMDGVNTQIRQQVKWLFDSLDVELDAGVTAINQTMRSLVDALASLINDAFEDSFYDLKVWLKDALTKIKDEIGDFDDDMMYQLKLIRRKMGGGRSSEPSAKDNPDDWLKWWSDLISDLLGKLADALPDELLELVEDFKALGQKFPFSIPWDIAYLVGLFAHSPVTPVFDYPVPYGYANGEVLIASVHVDLSPWDGVALAIRNTQLVGFAIWLAFNTSKLSLYLKLPGSKGE